MLLKYVICFLKSSMRYLADCSFSEQSDKELELFRISECVSYSTNEKTVNLDIFS